MGLFDIFGSGDQSQAAADQIRSLQQALATLQGYYGQAQDALTQNYTAGLQPFLQNYAQAGQGTTQLGNVLGLNGPNGSQQALETFENTPGYQFTVQQGDNAINANAGASGTLNSGNTLKALSDYNRNAAQTGYNNYVSQLQPYLGYSSQSAGGIGNLYAGLGNQLGNLLQSEGNAAYGGISSMGNAQANAALSGLNGSANSLNFGMNLLSGLSQFLPMPMPG